MLAIGNVERALNAVWGVRETRPWVRRIPDYLAVLVVAPLVLGVAISLRATLESQGFLRWALQHPLFDAAYHTGLRQLPVLLLVIGFSFLYWFLPNTRVRWLSALLGGLAAGLLFSIAQQAYQDLSIGAARAGAVFGVLANGVLFLVWIYFSWSIVLFGAEVSYAHQTLAALPARGARRAGEPRRARGAGPRHRRAVRASLPRRRSALDRRRAVGGARRAAAHGAQRARSADAGGHRRARAAASRRARCSRRARWSTSACPTCWRRCAAPATRRSALPEVARAVAEVLAEVDRAAEAAAAGRNLRDLVEALGPAVDRPPSAS